MLAHGPWLSPHTRYRGPGLFPLGPQASRVPRACPQATRSQPAASAPGTQQAGTVGHPQTTQPPNSRQRPINNFCAKATATAVCHGGAAGESKSLTNSLGPGRGDVSEVGTMWPRPLLDDAFSGAVSASVYMAAMHHSIPVLQVPGAGPAPLETIKLAQSKQHRAVTFALAPPGPARVWKQSS